MDFSLQDKSEVDELMEAVTHLVQDYTDFQYYEEARVGRKKLLSELNKPTAHDFQRCG